MRHIFDLEKIQSLLTDFNAITDFHVSLFNDELEAIGGCQSAQSPCDPIRGCREGLAACCACDRAAFQAAAKQNAPYIYRCHAGLTEAVAPIFLEGRLIGYLVFGRILSYASYEEAWQSVSARCAHLPLKQQELEHLCRQVPLVPEKKILASAQLLSAVSSYVALERMVRRRAEDQTFRLEQYLNAHYTEPITTEEICRRMQLSRTQLYRISQKTYGRGAAQQIRKMRIDLAKKLLEEQPAMGIAEVASACGFSEYNYFIHVFSETVGVSPGLYRKQMR